MYIYIYSKLSKDPPRALLLFKKKTPESCIVLLTFQRIQTKCDRSRRGAYVGLVAENTVREACVTLVRKCVPNYELTAFQRVLWGVIIVVCSAGCGILFPKVTDLITYMGGTLAAGLMLIFPALISKLVFDRKTWVADPPLG